MKQNILSICLLLFTGSVFAQITVTNSTFPVAGDTLFTRVDNMPTGITITPSGGSEQTWDFSSLQSPNIRQEIYANAADSPDFVEFPDAEMTRPFNQVGELFINVTDNVFEGLGYIGPDPLNIGVFLLAQFEPTVIERRAPMEFFDINNDNSAILVAFSTENIPGGLLDSLPVTPDSIRVNTIIDRLDVVDAWGTLTIPGGTYEVLREKRYENRQTSLEVKVGVGPFAAWLDITDAFDIPGVGLDTIVTYHYMSNDSKEPIAVVTVDPMDEVTPTRVQYKSLDVIDALNNVVDSGKPNIYAYPNPAVEEVNFQFSNLPAGQYNLTIYNILGVEVWDSSYHINNNRTINVNIADLRKGTYLYSLTNSKSKTITTKRLVVIRP